jgi:hypothetical protein
MLKAWRAYKALNEEQKQIIKEKQLKVRKPVDETIALLQPIVDTAKASAGFGPGCVMALAILAGIGGLIYGSNENWPASKMWTLVLICGGIFTVCLILRLMTPKIDLSDNLRACVLPMLYVFREDVDPGEPLELTLDLRKPMIKEKLVREEKPRERLTEKFYNDPWMSADAVLVDGSRLRWSVIDTLRHRSVTKKGRSGKWKTKTKLSKKCNVDVELTVRNKAYEVSGGEAGEKKTTLTASKKMKHDGAGPVDPKDIIEVITDLFKRVSPAK